MRYFARLLALGAALALIVYGMIQPVDQDQRWLLALWGPDLSWTDVANMWLRGILTMRLMWFAFAMVVVWATIWGVALRKPREARATERSRTDREAAFPSSAPSATTP